MKRILLLLLLMLCLAPIVIQDRGHLYFMTLIMIWCVFAIGYDLVFGVTGLLSFGHAAFLGVGSYVFAFIVIQNPALFPLAVIAAGLRGTRRRCRQGTSRRRSRRGGLAADHRQRHSRCASPSGRDAH